ncbi:ClpP/crotonase [Tothia fuscella]|uniref:ClpP/crotonase n=1 Tax=Tothia fuscella TaxID=1048955 RepID=A0A9P4NGF5_9PEZI|nr:ClpP/crotonase [Tothia fuscella]
MSSPHSPHSPIKILIANRSEIACRLIRTYSLYPNIQTVALFTPSEKDATHVRLATSSVALLGEGPRAYLNASNIFNIAKKEGCWGIAPGYGFLSEDAGLVRLCEDEGIVFIGPTSEQLGRLGNKISARALAVDVGVPILDGTKTVLGGGSSVMDVLAFARSVGRGSKIILKAAAGGGGRGIRIIDDASDEQAIRLAYEACRREALASFGDGSLFAERYLHGAKHIEVQLLGDDTGEVCHFWERECSLQRRNQKVVEIAPSHSITQQLRRAIIEAAMKLGKAVKLRSLATIEFLVDAATGDFYFMEANPRIQVEHPITEQINGVDLVDLQLQVALGQTFADLNIPREPPPPRLSSIQLRINAESFAPDGTTQPGAGTIRQAHFPTGAGVRVETAVEGGRPYAVSPLFDSLLAKLIVTAFSYESALRLARWAIDETRIVGCRTNQAFLMALLDLPTVQENKSNILTIQDNFEELYSATQHFEEALQAKVDHTFGETTAPKEKVAIVERPADCEPLSAQLTGVVLALKVNEGDKITAGQELVVLEAMKMEHSVRSARDGLVIKVAVKQGEQVNAGDTLLFIRSEGDNLPTTTNGVNEIEDPEELRPELTELKERKAFLRYAGREGDVVKRHANGYLTGRENLDLLVDKDSFIEYGDLVVAAQRKRYPLSRLISRTSGDGIIVGWAKMDAHRVAVVLGDYLVLAGTQGHFHHGKLDRIFQSIIDHPAPLVFYAEGGGGRPGDTDTLSVAGLKTPSFALMGEIKARGIPSVAVVNGYCFAGNAAFLGTCDIIIATRGGSKDAATRKSTTIGMGGQAMIEGGGLGRFEHEFIGPVDVHMRSGGIDVLVDTEVEAAPLVRKIVSLFTQPQLPPAKSPYTADPLRLRTAVPPLTSRRRAYDVRHVINFLLDDDSFIEFCPEWGLSVLTGFGRINGRAIAIMASSSSSPLGGAIDVASGAKVNRLLRLLIRVGGMHLLSLCDTPGFMVGPDFERSTEAQGAGSTYRCFGDWFGNFQEFALLGGRALGVVLRNGFGLGGQAMLGGGSLTNSMCVAWPSAVFGGMGIEGAVRLAYKKELEAIEDVEKRKKREQEMIDQMYSDGSAINMAMAAEIDSVIDPATTRRWLEQMMEVLPERVPNYMKARGRARM